MHRRRLKIAGAQLASQVGQRDENLARARLLVERAAAQRAQLVVLPELFSPGYAASRSLWALAETGEGPTLRWLSRTAAELGVYLGGGYVERDGTDLFNCWALVDPRGHLLGRVHKTFTEYACFAPGEASSHVIETPLGTLGVGICADNHRTAMLRLFQRERVELVLMPHAWPLPARPSLLVSEHDMLRQTREADDWARLYALRLGVPALMVNQVGPLGARWEGIAGRLFDPRTFHFGGHSSIAAADGTVVCRLGEDEGVLAAELTLDPSRRNTIAPPDHLGYVTPADGAAVFRHLVVPAAAVAGRLRYRLSRERRRLPLTAG